MKLNANPTLDQFSRASVLLLHSRGAAAQDLLSINLKDPQKTFGRRFGSHHITLQWKSGCTVSHMEPRVKVQRQRGAVAFTKLRYIQPLKLGSVFMCNIVQLM